MNNFEKNHELGEPENFSIKFKRRTQLMALNVIKMVDTLPNKSSAWIIGKQILRSSTSTAANFRAVCQARSLKERFAKLSIVVKEADETLFWLELIEKAQLAKPTEQFKQLEFESSAILKVISSYRATLKRKLNT